jgi:transcriptional regulator with XRE-family HTH domain
VAAAGPATQSLAALLGPTLDLAALCSALGLQQSEVMKLLRGKALLTPEQIEAVARATALPAEEIAGTVRPLPLKLVAKAEHPRWRAAWTRRAERLQVTEAQARLTGGYGTFALAARETGAEEPDWDARLRQFLREQDDPGGDG